MNTIATITRKQKELNNDLQKACSNGYVGAIKKLIEAGADLHADDDKCFIVASSFGHLDAMEYLKEQGSNIHTQQGQALTAAAFYGSLNAVKYLVEEGVDIHSKNDDALSVASYKCKLDIVQYLIEKGANVQARGNSLLLNVVNQDAVEIVEYYITNEHFHVNVALEHAVKANAMKTIDWCNQYINITNLNKKLIAELPNHEASMKRQKI